MTRNNINLIMLWIVVGFIWDLDQQNVLMNQEVCLILNCCPRNPKRKAGEKEDLKDC